MKRKITGILTPLCFTLIAGFGTGLSAQTLYSEEVSRGLSFSYGYCDRFRLEIKSDSGGTYESIPSVDGFERAFSAGSFAAGHDIRVQKFKSLAAIEALCESLLAK